MDRDAQCYLINWIGGFSFLFLILFSAIRGCEVCETNSTERLKTRFEAGVIADTTITIHNGIQE